jgi:hypothetical protein
MSSRTTNLRLTWPLVGSLVFALAGGSVVAQQKTDQRPTIPVYDEPQVETNWVNLASSPLTFQVSNNKRFLELANSSGKVVVEYQLACALTRDHKAIRLTRKLPARILRLELNDFVMNPTPSEGKRDYCAVKGAQFVVWEVRFADGTNWDAM